MTSERHILEVAYVRTLLPVSRLWRQSADRALAGIGVSASAGWALVQVGRMGDDVRQTDLAQKLDVTAASLVRVLDRMVAGELVDRHADAVDGRVSRVRLTAKGRDLATKIEHRFSALRHEMFDGLSDADLRSALKVSEHLETAFARRRGA